VSEWPGGPTLSGGPDADPTPKYLRICRAIAEAVESGRLASEQVLPAQRAMAEHFGVTVMTIRQAMSLLVEQGLLRVEHGRGTFVAPQAHRMPLDGLSSFARQIAETGQISRCDILAAQVIIAPPGVQARMGLLDEAVFCITRLRWLDETPLVYSMSLLEPMVGRQLDPDSLVHGSLYEVLAEQCGIVVGSATETFRADALADEEAAALRRPVGAPALISSRLTFSRAGRPVVDDRAIMPGDAVVLCTERSVDDVDLRFRLPSDDPLLTRGSLLSDPPIARPPREGD
jgi:GntR family transcriptional regulator